MSFQLQVNGESSADLKRLPFTRCFFFTLVDFIVLLGPPVFPCTEQQPEAGEKPLHQYWAELQWKDLLLKDQTHLKHMIYEDDLCVTVITKPKYSKT